MERRTSRFSQGRYAEDYLSRRKQNWRGGTESNEQKEAAEGVKWEPKIFSSAADDDPVFCTLAMTTGWQLNAERTKGVWRFDREKAEKATKPYHGDIKPFG